MDVREHGQGLAQQRIRTVIGVVFAFAISWHLLFGGSHIAIWYTIYGSWADVVLCLFVMSRANADDPAEDDDESEASDV